MYLSTSYVGIFTEQKFCETKKFSKSLKLIQIRKHATHAFKF